MPIDKLKMATAYAHTIGNLPLKVKIGVKRLSNPVVPSSPSTQKCNLFGKKH